MRAEDAARCGVCRDYLFIYRKKSACRRKPEATLGSAFHVSVSCRMDTDTEAAARGTPLALSCSLVTLQRRGFASFNPEGVTGPSSKTCNTLSRLTLTDPTEQLLQPGGPEGKGCTTEVPIRKIRVPCTWGSPSTFQCSQRVYLVIGPLPRFAFGIVTTDRGGCLIFSLLLILWL